MAPLQKVNTAAIVTAEPHPLLWTRDEYYRLADQGWFRDKHVELIDGEIIEMSPMLGPHATAVTKTGDTLRLLFGAGYFIRIQMPLSLDRSSEPEPDVAVIAGTPSDYRSAHPTTAALVVEISDTTLRFDQTRKADLYAQAGIPELWIVNLVDERLEVYRAPAATSDASRRAYSSVSALQPTDSISPLAIPHAAVTVSDLLP